MECHLNNVDPDDISDTLVKIERSLGFRFAHNELKGIRTFGELCDHIRDKVEGRHVDDCTTQQAFYKIRQVTARIQDLDEKTITPLSRLKELFPLKERRKNIRRLKNNLELTFTILAWPRKKFKFNTVGELTLKMASHHYHKSRRRPDTVNKNEIEQTIINIFSHDLFLNLSVLTRTATFD